MPPSTFEANANVWRGYTCLLITLAAVGIVLADSRCLAFWRPDGFALNAAPTGYCKYQCHQAASRLPHTARALRLPGRSAPTPTPAREAGGRNLCCLSFSVSAAGFATSSAFLAYLVVDSAIGIACRHQFRRGMGAVLVHHVAVGIAVAAFLLPSPPRGFFLYVWGEALTACRLLPPQPRWWARSVAFAFRRMLWVYVLCRDLTFVPHTAAMFGKLGAALPPLIALLLLCLDCAWWREHRRSGADMHMKAKRSQPCPDLEDGRPLCGSTDLLPELSDRATAYAQQGAGGPRTTSPESVVSITSDLEAAGGAMVARRV